MRATDITIKTMTLMAPPNVWENKYPPKARKKRDLVFVTRESALKEKAVFKKKVEVAANAHEIILEPRG